MAITRTPSQQAVIQNRGGTLLVSAAAGSGKTSVLVDRLLDRILNEGKRIDQFLIITFTKSAAEELRIRIGRTIAERIREDPQNRHLRQQSVLLYHAQISTIHALCTVLLREWGHVLDVPVDFSLCEEEDARILMLQALTDLLEERYDSIDPEGNFAKLLDVLAFGRDDSRLIDIVLDVYVRMQSHADPIAWLEAQKEILALRGVLDAGDTVWGRLLLEDTQQVTRYWQETIVRSIEMIQEEPSLLPYAESLTETQEALLQFQHATTQSWDHAVAACQIPFPKLKAVRNCPNPGLQERIKLLRGQCKDAMERLEQRFSCSSDALLDDIRMLYPAMVGLLDLVEDFSLRYAALKTRKGMLDFSDLEHKTVELLIGENGEPTDMACQVGSRFAEIMVDEYQDTNQVQNTIFSALSQDEKNLFFVGDVKQSIYRFRLADPTIFLEKYRRFVPFDQAVEGQSRKILLSQNFRSRPQVLDAVNYVFSNIMSERLGEMNYTPEEALYSGGSFPPGEGYETELHVLNLEGLSEDGEGIIPGKHEMEARFAASKIAHLLKEPFSLSDGEGGTRAITPDDIAILLRSPGSVRHHYINALREAQIPWSSEEEGDFFESTEVSVMLSYLKIIDNPRQDIPLLAVLHSPLCTFDGEQLAKLRLAGEGDIYEALQAAAQAGDERCRRFLEELETLRFAAIDVSSHELLWSLYEKTDALEVFSRMPGGAQRKENLIALYELACRFEHSGHRGLFGFLFHLSKIQEHGSRISKGSTSEGAGVKILSIHRSKGLEYPVVFLCGLGKRFNASDIQTPMLFHPLLGLGPRGIDEQCMVEFQTLPREAIALQLKREMLAEEMRLLYVAMTRAKEKLILTHSLSYGEGDLRKLSTYVASPLDPNVLSSCSSAGQWILLSAMTRPEGEVLRKLAEIEAIDGTASTDFPWKVCYHTGVSVPEKGLDWMTRSPSSTNQEDVDPEDIWARLHWRYPFEPLSEIPAKITATSLVKTTTLVNRQESVAEHTLETASFPRPRFVAEKLGLTSAQRGSALHTVMQNITIAKTKSIEEIQEEVYRLTIAQYLTQQEAESIQVKQVHAFFCSSLGQSMKSATELHREFPFSILVPAGLYYEDVPREEALLLQGVVDCWFETEEGITIVDFKTNHISEDLAQQTAQTYWQQMNTYAYALEAITGKTIAHRILWFLTPQCAVEL